jgi:hypothetical protein
MEVYRAGVSAEITVEAQDEQGSVVLPNSATFIVTDESGTEVATGPADISTGAAVITLTPTQMALADGALRGARTVTVDFATDAGTVANSTTFLIETARTLEIMRNTFQTFAQAELTASELPSLTSWGIKTDYEKRQALVGAYHNIVKLRFTVDRPNAQNRIVDRLWETEYQGGRIIREISDITDLDAAEFARLPAQFVGAIHRAQVAEADVLLGGDVVGEQRRMGLMSHTIGEVSQMFRPGKPVLGPVSPEALHHLAGYVRTSGVVRR